MKEERIIAKVWKNNSNGQKLVTIPRKSKIEDGNYVEVKKVE
jgi:hypothetical protein